MNHLCGLPGTPHPILATQLNSLYNTACCNNKEHQDYAHIVAESSQPPANLTELFINMVKAIWEAKGMDGSINKPVTTAYADHLWSAVLANYGGASAKQFAEGKLDYTTPNYQMLAALHRNCWQFAAAKNYQQLRALSNALIGEDGKLRSFQAFKQAAEAINIEHTRWLQTEYNLAVNGSQMAGKWVGIIEHQETFPLLQFDAVLDKQTTDLCRDLNGTTLPIHHPFWNTFYPPNHFGCRSTVRQIQAHTAHETPHDKIPHADIPPMFQTNLAQQKLIFPPKHPYYDGLPDNIDSAGGLRNQMRDIAVEKLTDKTVEVAEIGTVTITKAGLRKCASQQLQPEFYSIKNQMLPIANLLLANAHNIVEETNKANNELKVWKASIKGLPHFKVVIKQELHNGKIKTVLYSITAHK